MKAHFLVNCPKMDKRKIGRGEDAPPVSEDGVMIICDGTGATGQSEHEICEGRYPGGIYTSAYLGSRETSRLAEEFLKKNYDRIISSFSESKALEWIVQSLGNTIQNGLDAFRNENGLKLTVRGRSFKLLPTTFTAVVYKICDGYVDVIVFCAGDSHALWWDCDGGLCQLSADDNEMEEGIDEGDCKINNCISADSDFHINYLCHRLPPKGILVAASDGFTDPIAFFEQERFLIRWIRDFSSSSEITESSVRGMSDGISGQMDEIGFSRMDDCSISGAIIGYQNGGELIQAIDKRLDFLEANYFLPYQELKRSRAKLRQTKDETEQSMIDNIEKGILKFVSRENTRIEDPRLQSLLSADAVRWEKEEIDLKIQKEMEEQKQRINELTQRLFVRYQDFLKTLCPLPMKWSSRQSKRFPQDIIDAMKQCVCAEEEIERLHRRCNDRLNQIKSLPEIGKETCGIKNVIDRAEDFCWELRNLCNRIEAHTRNRHRIEIFFGDNRKMAQYCQEDCVNKFQILSSYCEEEIRMHSLYDAKNMMLELKRQIDELANSNGDDRISRRKLDLYQNLVRRRGYALAAELFQKEQYEAFVPPQNSLCNCAGCQKDFRNLQNELEHIVANQNMLKKKYSEQYISRVRSAEIRTVEIKKK